MDMTAGHKKLVPYPASLKMSDAHVEIPLHATAGQHRHTIEHSLRVNLRFSSRIGKQAMQVSQPCTLFHQFGTGQTACRKIHNGRNHQLHNHLLLNDALSDSASALRQNKLKG
ncbi:hypothetical protein D3C84_812190 [compost metagenome]